MQPKRDSRCTFEAQWMVRRIWDFGEDAIFFTGGIGENNAHIRHDSCAAFTGCRLDSLQNERTSDDDTFTYANGHPVSQVPILAGNIVPRT